MFNLEFTASAEDDLRYFRKYEQNMLLDAIEQQLGGEPATKTRNRKPLRPNELSKWELRVSEYRIFYDVDEITLTVTVKAVGYKEHNRLFIRGKEFHL